MTPRGIRLNNPGNIRHSKDKWLGLTPDQPDAEFCAFSLPEYGIRAMVKILLKHQLVNKCESILAQIRKWAPPTENNTEAYIKAVCSALALSRYDPLDVRDYQTCLRLVKAIIRHENGIQPYDDATIAKGLELAGVA